MSEVSPAATNVIAFVSRRPATPRVARPDTPASIIARAFWDRLGDTNLSSYAVQSAVDGVLNELARHWRAEGERQASDRLTVEIVQLRAVIARRDGGMAPFIVEHPPVEG